MPDFGLTEALAKALRASKEVPVLRPGEARLAANAAKTAPEATAPVVPKAAPSVQAPPAEPPPGAIQEPPVNPSAPPQDMAAPPPPDPAAATPAPPDVAAGAADAAPPSPAPALSEEPVAPPAQPVAPDAIAPAKTLPPEGAPDPVAPVLTPIQEQAQRFVHANMEDFKGTLNMTHMPNVDVMSSPDGVKAAILQVAEDNKAAIEAARGTAATNEQLAGLAQDMSIDSQTLQQVFDREFGPTADAAAGDQRRAVITAARMIEQNEAGTILALSDKIANGTATAAEEIQFEQHTQAMLDWRTRLAGASAEQGRNLQALSIPVGLEADVKEHIANIIRQNNPDRQAMAAAIRLAGTPEGVANIISGMSKYSLAQRVGKASFGLLQRIFINGILSGPPTWAKVLIGNNVNLAMNQFDLYAAGVGRGIYGLAARLGGFPTAEEGVQMGDAVAHMHGVISAGADALRVAGRVFKSGQSLDLIARAGEGSTPVSTNSFNVMVPEIRDSYFGSIMRGIDTAVDFPGSRIISPMDEMTKTVGFRGYGTMMALKDVRTRLANGTLRPEDAPAVMQDLMQNMSPEMQQAADAWGHRMTYQTPFTPGGVGEAFTGVLNKAPVLRFIFPFMRTATNIFKQSLVERTPLAIFSARLRNQIAAGGFEGDLAKSRIATGTAVLGMFAWMAINDRITGAAPKDPKQRAAWELDGRTPYSFRVTNPVTGQDSWHDYTWFEPIATLAGATADAVQVQSYIHGYDETDTMMPHEDMLNDAIAHIAASVITNTSNKTFMMGAAQASEAYNDPKRALSMWGQQIGASLVPFSGTTKFIRNEQDPYLRQARTLIDKIRDDLPTGLGVKGSKTLPARLNVFGEARTHKGGNSILGPLDPFAGSPSTADDVTNEIQSVMEQTRTVPITMPVNRLAYLGSERGMEGGQGMRLNPSEYNDYITKSRADPIFDGSTLTFREKLQQVIASPTYQLATPANRSLLLSNVQHNADKIGAEHLWKDNQDFRERMQEWTAKGNRLKLGQ